MENWFKFIVIVVKDQVKVLVLWQTKLVTSFPDKQSHNKNFIKPHRTEEISKEASIICKYICEIE